ncbi:hypothetical protein BDN72DRAFT_348169 [Pluteus cervinus]|uniref:Uncharacterized protein n=1 Tax=Pluteus cervinus TaxID=181527 RepID=A0ACD3ABE1_9AGAR|nr:hypothetical protein BDN72DRAFT_348169 [Pluteus cervinus]
MQDLLSASTPSSDEAQYPHLFDGFDVDNQTGFMPPDPPVSRLPFPWTLWEDVLDEAIHRKLQLGEKSGLTRGEEEESEMWRRCVRELPIKPISHSLASSEALLRRAHLVLGWTMHFYVHTLPPTSPIRIPPPISIPLLQVSEKLQLPPVLTYSDVVLYNWRSIDTDANDDDDDASQAPSASSWTHPGISLATPLRINTTFTSTPDESKFYLTSARMELRGVEALSLMRSIIHEISISDDNSVRRVTTNLTNMKDVIRDVKELMMDVRSGVGFETFYRDIRPWFRGQDSSASNQGRMWVFGGLEEWNEGVDEYNLRLDIDGDLKTYTYPPLLRRERLIQPTDLSGSSTGQSALIQIFDIFLGVCSAAKEEMGVLTKMQKYMPRHHRAFLSYLMSTEHKVQEFVLRGKDDDRVNHIGTGTNLGGNEERDALRSAYYDARNTLKQLRTEHLVIVAQYILAPARRESTGGSPGTKGTGGTDTFKFLKSIRDLTT